MLPSQPRTQRGFSPPYIPILLLMVIVLVYFFGWIVLVWVVAAALMITLGVAIHDKIVGTSGHEVQHQVNAVPQPRAAAHLKQQDSRKQLQWPTTAVLSKDPKVEVYMDWVSLGGVSPGEVLGFTTRGLTRFGQKEIVFCLKQVTNEHIKTVLSLLRLIMQMALQGRRVDVNGLTELGGKGVFGRPGFTGIGYARPHAMDSLVRAAGLDYQQCLLASALMRTELMAARKFGLSRVLVRQGETARFFPYPWWNDIERESVLTEKELSLSAFSAGEITQLPGLYVLRENNTVTVHIARQVQPLLTRDFDQHDAQVLSTELVPGSADGMLVWRPGTAHPVAISARLSTVGAGELGEEKSIQRLGGCFAAISRSPDGRQGADLAEDGFAIFLVEPDWTGFKRALQAVGSFKCHGQGGLLDFGINWQG